MSQMLNKMSSKWASPYSRRLSCFLNNPLCSVHRPVHPMNYRVNRPGPSSKRFRTYYDQGFCVWGLVMCNHTAGFLWRVNSEWCMTFGIQKKVDYLDTDMCARPVHYLQSHPLRRILYPDQWVVNMPPAFFIWKLKFGNSKGVQCMMSSRHADYTKNWIPKMSPCFPQNTINEIWYWISGTRM